MSFYSPASTPRLLLKRLLNIQLHKLTSDHQQPSLIQLKTGRTPIHTNTKILIDRRAQSGYNQLKCTSDIARLTYEGWRTGRPLSKRTAYSTKMIKKKKRLTENITSYTFDVLHSSHPFQHWLVVFLRPSARLHGFWHQNTSGTLVPTSLLCSSSARTVDREPETFDQNRPSSIAVVGEERIKFSFETLNFQVMSEAQTKLHGYFRSDEPC